MTADNRLDFAYCSAEGFDVGFHETRHELHQHKPAEMSSCIGRKRRQLRECLSLRFTMNAGSARIDDKQDAPGFGEVGAHEDRRRVVF